MKFPEIFSYRRRQFLQLSLLVTASSITWSCNQSIAKSGKGNIIIIGAGIAGLAAARQLKSSGFEVTVLEGKNRIGGRIYTDKSLGLPIDLGAAWIHGINKNPIAKLAQDFKINIQKTNYDNIYLYGSNGKRLNEAEIASSYALFQKVIRQAKEMSEKLDRDISVAEAVKRILSKEKLVPQQQNNLRWQLNSNLVVETGTDLENISMWEWNEDEAFGGDDCLFPGGCDQIIQSLAQGIDVKLQQKVIAIEYGKQAVSVKTEKGNFQGDAAIVTLPLGVLKSGNINFSPALPQNKRAAIERLNMGVLNKVVLKFPKVFWQQNYDMLGYASAKAQDFSEFINWQHYTGAPVLIALTGGSFARSLELVSETEVGDRVMQLLRNLYGNSIPNPEAVLRTKWGADPFAFGSYSTMPVGAKGSDRTFLAEPVAKRLFFAGEATSPEYPATVHGAFLSGIREAQRIAKEF